MSRYSAIGPVRTHQSRASPRMPRATRRQMPALYGQSAQERTWAAHARSEGHLHGSCDGPGQAEMRGVAAHVGAGDIARPKRGPVVRVADVVHVQPPGGRGALEWMRIAHAGID